MDILFLLGEVASPSQRNGCCDTPLLAG
uniref:Uncharacterized protein n=1 Tax=Anguilla anguilla TaxID=7936 RepID=A0A0E9TX32_ANGAN